MTRIVLDWSGRDGAPPARVGDPAPCRYCNRPAMLRHPDNGQPCHKVCAERAYAAARTNAGGGRR